MRKILITGASRGIGKEIALKLLKEGHSISLGVRKKEQLTNTPLDPKLHNPKRFMANTYDATIKNSSKEWIENTARNFKAVFATTPAL